MQKSDKIVISFFIFLAVSFPIWMIYTNSHYGISDFSIELFLPTSIEYIEKEHSYNLPLQKIFDTMTNPLIYPTVLPRNIISAEIVNSSENEIIVEYEIAEAGVQTKLLAKHTLEPYEKHTIEILDGDGQGTKIIQDFSEKNSKTVILTKVFFNFKGILSPLTYIPERNLTHALDTVIDSFATYVNETDTK